MCLGTISPIDIAFVIVSCVFKNGVVDDLKKRYNEYVAKKKTKALSMETTPNVDSENITRVYSSENVLHSYKALFCRRCYIYDCTDHSMVLFVFFFCLLFFKYFSFIDFIMPGVCTKADIPTKQCNNHCFMNYLPDEESSEVATKGIVYKLSILF